MSSGIREYRLQKSSIISTKEGMSIRFSESDVRSMGRGAMGGRGIRLDKTDTVIGLGDATR